MRLASMTLIALLTSCDGDPPTTDKAPTKPKASDVKADAEPDAKTQAKLETKNDAKSDGGAEAKAESKADADADAKAEDAPPTDEDPPVAPPQAAGPTQGIPGAAVPIPVETSGPFSLVAKAGTRMGLHPLFDDEVAVSVGPHLIRVDKDGAVAPDARLLAGLPTPRDPGMKLSDTLSAWYVLAAGGRWPDEVIMRATIESGFRSDVELPLAMRFTGERWQAMATGNKRYKWWPVEVHPWIDGSLLARRALMPVYDGVDPADPEDEPSQAQRQAVAKAMGRAKTLIVIRGQPKSPDIGGIVAFQSWGSGDILAVSAERQPQLVVAGVDGVTSKTKLPVVEGGNVDVAGIEARSTDDAYVFGSEGAPESDHVPYLVHASGGKMTRIATPECRDIGAVAEDAAGELWVLCDNVPNTEWQMDGGSLWHRGSGGAWAQSEFPEAWGKPTQVVFTGGELWVGTRQAVARTGKVERSVQLGDLDEIGLRFFEWGDPLPIEGYCAGVTFRLKSKVDEAEALEAKLEAAKLASDGWWKVRLRRIDYRAQEILALELHGATQAEDVRRFQRAFDKALGDVMHPPQCYLHGGEEGEQSEVGVLATWSGGN